MKTEQNKTAYLDLFSGIGGFALGAYWDDPTIDAITHLLCEAEDSDWISDYDTRHKEEL